MYPKKESKKTTVENFKIPSEWKPKEENRWVIMSKIIPWEKFEEEYAKQFSENKGAPAKPFRMALGSYVDFDADEVVEFHAESLSKIETQNGTIQKFREKTGKMVRGKPR
jgi:hypothetical protein